MAARAGTWKVKMVMGTGHSVNGVIKDGKKIIFCGNVPSGGTADGY